MTTAHYLGEENQMMKRNHAYEVTITNREDNVIRLQAAGVPYSFYYESREKLEKEWKMLKAGTLSETQKAGKQILDQA